MSIAIVFETHATSEDNEAGVPILLDWRLRECEYGELNGAPRAVVHGDRARYLDARYPGGESWRAAVALEELVAEDLRWRPGWTYLMVGPNAASASTPPSSPRRGGQR